MARHIAEKELQRAIDVLTPLFGKIRVIEHVPAKREPLYDGRCCVYSSPFLMEGTAGRQERILEITARSPMAEQLQEELYRDDLTGVYNRRYLNELRFLEHGKAAPQRMGLILLDLRRFKRINDTRGHLAGDEVLKQVAARLEACRVAGESVIRFGGDEFVVLMQDCDEDHVTRRMEHLRREAERITPADFGCAWTGTFQEDRYLLGQLLDAADRRMYAEKKQPKI